jgi:hypothetical protein
MGSNEFITTYYFPPQLGDDGQTLVTFRRGTLDRFWKNILLALHLLAFSQIVQ